MPFFCTCGVGFDAFVSLQFSKAGRRGPLTYLEKTLLESLKYRPETYELEMDGSTLRYKAFLIACGNASQYGNNAYIAPQATLNDGLLDVTILEPFTVLDVRRSLSSSSTRPLTRTAGLRRSVARHSVFTVLNRG